jgi:hypothetical protein
MGPGEILLLVQAIQAVIAAAPQIAELAVKTKDYIAALFGAGIITKEQQDKLHAHVDAVCAAAIAGTELPHWTVEADPV